MQSFTPAQKKSLEGWAEQRDSLLSDIGNYSTELNTLKTSTKSEGLALADLHKSIAEARGRLSELNALEERHEKSLNVDIVALELRKSRLEGEVSLLEEKAKGSVERFEIVTKATESIQTAHDILENNLETVNETVGAIVTEGQKHASNMKTIMAEISALSSEVIEKSNKNITTADVTLNKLTMYIIDGQRPIPVRRTYPLGHPNAPKE